MPTYIPYLLLVGLPSSVFGYLRYRAYVNLVKHIVDAEGSKGLRAMKHVAGPWRRVGSTHIAGKKQLLTEARPDPSEPTQLRQAS